MSDATTEVDFHKVTMADYKGPLSPQILSFFIGYLVETWQWMLTTGLKRLTREEALGEAEWMELLQKASSLWLEFRENKGVKYLLRLTVFRGIQDVISCAKTGQDVENWWKAIHYQFDRLENNPPWDDSLDEAAMALIPLAQILKSDNLLEIIARHRRIPEDLTDAFIKQHKAW